MNGLFHPSSVPDPTAAPLYLIAESGSGVVLVATTPRGVCALLPGDDPDALVRELRRRVPEARPSEGDPVLLDLAERAVRLVEDGGEEPLPLDPRGTRFQRQVWNAIGGIPAGAVASYAEIASRIGAPGAARAVARACAANTIAIAIPCHRVVRSDGRLGGYRWGPTRKRALLAREAAA